MNSESARAMELDSVSEVGVGQEEGVGEGKGGREGGAGGRALRDGSDAKSVWRRPKFESQLVTSKSNSRGSNTLF